jgi:hypothetical protein
MENRRRFLLQGFLATGVLLAVFFFCRYRAHFRIALRGYVKALLVGLCFLPILWIKVGLP